MDKCFNIKEKKEKKVILLWQIIILICFFALWEILSYFDIIDSFLFSSPSDIIKLMIKYIKTGELFRHMYISLIEVLLGVTIGTFMGIIIASILWYSERLSKIFDPFFAVLNALPKTALAPIIIIWAGTGIRGIVVVAISILIVITILSVYNYFRNVEEDKIKMMKSFNASKTQIYTKLIFPSNIMNIINVIKINIGMSWVGVIVGEFLVSKEGLGYLIMYGGQVFKLNLVMMGVFVLAILAFLMNVIVELIDNKFKK